MVDQIKKWNLQFFFFFTVRRTFSNRGYRLINKVETSFWF